MGAEREFQKQIKQQAISQIDYTRKAWNEGMDLLQRLVQDACVHQGVYSIDIDHGELNALLNDVRTYLYKHRGQV